MKTIGENLNVIKKVIGQAFKDRNPEPFKRWLWKKRRLAWIGSTSIWAPHARAVPN